MHKFNFLFRLQESCKRCLDPPSGSLPLWHVQKYRLQDLFALLMFGQYNDWDLRPNAVECH
jgi:hypothetical protein